MGSDLAMIHLLDYKTWPQGPSKTWPQQVYA